MQVLHGDHRLNVTIQVCLAVILHILCMSGYFKVYIHVPRVCIFALYFDEGEHISFSHVKYKSGIFLLSSFRGKFNVYLGASNAAHNNSYEELSNTRPKKPPARTSILRDVIESINTGNVET